MYVCVLAKMLYLSTIVFWQVDPHDITATPLERLKANRNKFSQNSNVLDVVDEKIMLGTEQLATSKKLTSMIRTSDSNAAAYRQSSGGYINGTMYGGITPVQLNVMDSTHPQPDMSVSTSYMNDSKDMLYSSNMGSALETTLQPTLQNTLSPMDFPQGLKMDDASSSASMLEQLLNPDPDNHIIQELENLLGKN